MGLTEGTARHPSLSRPPIHAWHRRHHCHHRTAHWLCCTPSGCRQVVKSCHSLPVWFELDVPPASAPATAASKLYTSLRAWSFPGPSPAPSQRHKLPPFWATCAAICKAWSCHSFLPNHPRTWPLTATATGLLLHPAFLDHACSCYRRLADEAVAESEWTVWRASEAGLFIHNLGSFWFANERFLIHCSLLLPQGSLLRPLRKQSVKSVVGPKSSDVLKSSWGNSTSVSGRLGDCEVSFDRYNDDLSCVKLHVVGVFFCLSGTRSAQGVGLFAVMLSLNFEFRAKRWLGRRGRWVFFTVLNAKGDAASNRSCVLIGGPCSTLSPARSLKDTSARALKTERGVIAGLG